MCVSDMIQNTAAVAGATAGVIVLLPVLGGVGAVSAVGGVISVAVGVGTTAYEYCSSKGC